MDEKQGAFSFEAAYSKLESILAELSNGETPLEKSLELYEMANKLLSLCSTKLTQAEQKIEMLIKNREGKVEAAPFAPESERVLDTPHDTAPRHY
ncbi:MAG: exodeoxyribonuclease VII small subunit [Chlamydiia bacterium]|nr:exodeoxyribonuclease VII small subunit [Chlamydiia bacterium]